MKTPIYPQTTIVYLTGAGLLALIFLALFVPTAYQEIKVAILACSLFGILILSHFSKLTWSHETLLAHISFAVFGLINSLHGLFNSAPGSVKVLTIMSAWPLLYAMFSAMLNRPSALRKLWTTLMVALTAILFYSYLFIFHMVGLVPDSLYFELNDKQGIGFYDGRVEYSLLSISSLLFLWPSYFHYFLNLVMNQKDTLRHWLILATTLALCILTGRRAVQLVALLSPLIILVSESLVGNIRSSVILIRHLVNFKNVLIFALAASCLFVTLGYFEVRLDAVIEDFLNGFNFHDTSNIAASDRSTQFTSLIESWLNGSLLFGAGNGSNTDYLRSYEMPWSYELTYVYLLYSTGIIGIFFYFGWYAWGLIRLRRALKQRPDIASHISSMVSGSFGLAIGAASNPYFGKFDYLWIIFLPHLLAGAVAYQRERNA